MTTMTKRARWAVPVGVGAVIAAVIAGPSMIASATSDLPDLSAQELLTRIAQAEPAALSGTAVYTARLGLPELPLDMQGPAGPVNLLSGSSTIRVWTDGQDSSRAAITGPMSEYSVVHSGPEAWTYSSQENKAVHYSLSEADLARLQAMQADEPQMPAGTEVPTPEEAAAELLAQTKEFTDYSVDSATQVAGRDAYQLGLVPSTDATLVDRVLIAVDAETFTPLRVQVWSNQDTTTPAMEVAFTDVSFSAPAASTFDFTVPQGATTQEVTVPLPTAEEMAAKDAADSDATAHQVLGTGWETVVVLDDIDTAALLADPAAALAGQVPAPVPGSAEDQLMSEFEHTDDGSAKGLSLDAASILAELVTPVDGGQAISSALVSVLITDDGRVLMGAVPVDTLIDLAG